MPIEMVENPRSEEAVAEDFVVDTTRAEQELGFAPDHQVEKTIREMIRR